jgi:hypothetical protein
MIMKVFIRTSDLGEKSPRLIAFYRDESAVPDDAHGEGMTVLTLPANAMIAERLYADAPPEAGEPIIMRLADDWRQRVGPTVLEAQATQRINEAFSPAEQISALRETVDLVIKHGPDASSWPTSAKQRKAEIDEKWKYIGEIKERLRALMPSMPADPTSDKAWPMRLAKRRQQP